MCLGIKRRIGIIRDYKRTDWRMYRREEERKRKLAKLATPSHRTSYPCGLTRGQGTIVHSFVYGRRVAICGPYFPNSYRVMTHALFATTLLRFQACSIGWMNFDHTPYPNRVPSPGSLLCFRSVRSLLSTTQHTAMWQDTPSSSPTLRTYRLLNSPSCLLAENTLILLLPQVCHIIIL